MAANVLRFRRSLTLTSSIISHTRHFSSSVATVGARPSSSLSTVEQNPRLFDVTQSKANGLAFQFISSRFISSRSRYNNDDLDGDQISPDAILFEGCDYNHWLITMDFPKDPKPSPEEMVETYVQTAAKVLGSVEEAKKKIYACSTTTYQGFQVEVSEEVSEQFKGLPGVVFVLPDSYIDPVNKEYGGDKYINGTIIPRPPPVQYGRQGGRYNDRNRDYNRPPRDRIEQNNAPGGGNYQGDRRGGMPSYQANYNQGEGSNINPARQSDFPQRDQGSYAHPEQRNFRGESGNLNPTPVGNYNQGGGRQEAGGQYDQSRGGQYGQGGGVGYGQGTGGQYGQGGGVGYGQGTGGQYGQGGGGRYGQGSGGQYGQPGGGYGQGSSGQYGQPVGGYGQGSGGQYSQPVGGYGQGSGGQYGQGSGGYGQGMGGQHGQGGSYGQGRGGQYGQGTGGGSYGQATGAQFGQGGGGNYGQGSGAGYGQGIGSASNQTPSQYGDPKFTQGNIGRQQGNHEVIEEAEAFNELIKMK